MKTLIKQFLVLFTLLFVFNSFMLAQGTQITLLHVNDSHSHLDAVGPKDINLEGTLGGIAKAAYVIGMVRATEQNVVLLHAGDFCVGDFFYNKYFGVPELQIMKQLDFDAMCVGNHEFDLGPVVLNDVLTQGFAYGSFPVLSANLDMTGYPPLQTWISPSIVKNVSGVKIGIFGLTIPSPLNNPYPVIVRDDIIPIAAQNVASLQNSGAVVIICLSHLGVAYDSVVAANVPGINFIIGAHDHYVFQQPIPINNPLGKQTLICQAGENYKYVGKLKFTYYNGNVTVNDYQVLPVDAQVPEVPEIQAVIVELKAGIVAQYGDVYNTVLGTASHDIDRSSDPNNPLRDTPLGDLITDAYRDNTNTKIAITANGLITEKIYSGPIVGADVFRAASYGFDTITGLGFTLATLDMRGSELLKGLEIGLSQLGITDDYFLQVSGMLFKYRSDKPVGKRVINGSVKINGHPLIPVARYSVTVNTGLLGLLMGMGVQVENVNVLPTPEYTAIKDFVIKLHTINYVTEGRIKDNSMSNDKNELNESNETSGNVHAFRLYNNFPNPFNPVTTIRYEIPVACIVSLKIYNLLGQVVASLIDGNQQAGAYEVKWNASGLASGVYFYKLETPTFREIKKLVLIK